MITCSQEGFSTYNYKDVNLPGFLKTSRREYGGFLFSGLEKGGGGELISNHEFSTKLERFLQPVIMTDQKSSNDSSITLSFLPWHINISAFRRASFPIDKLTDALTIGTPEL